jgi:hypothetical protein
MPKKSNEFVPKLKYYHIILISILLCPLLIINSNSINKKRGKEKLIKENETFMRKLYLRNLDFASDTAEICQKGSKDLQNYYVTGNGTEIGIKEDPITSENNPEYINALINLVSGEDDSMDNLMDYIMHIIPVLIFLAIAILFLPGWLVCCICCCADCCCCCCCKKTYCKLPFYIISCAFYALSICICIYGLSQSNSVFVGLADTECSLLKFIGEVLDGESREAKPKWEGINGIVGLFDKSLYEPDVATVDNPKLIVFVVAVFVVNESPVSDVFFLIVIVVSFTVGIVGLLLKSLYDPDVATVCKSRFIVLAVALFVVKLSPVSSLFFLIVIVESFITVAVGLSLKSL